MKNLLVILAFLLSWAGLDSFATANDNSGAEEKVFSSTRDGDEPEHPLVRDICIVSPSGAVFSGDGSSFTMSVRPTNTGRKTQTSVRSSFRFLKDGKVIDRALSRTFRNEILHSGSGMFSTGRYIHIIRHLLI